MLLLCNNISLDLYADANLQFKHSNPLFAFDKLECERTTQFKLPATPANDRAFALARIPAYAGTGMMRKFSAQLQAGTIVKDGYLYVSEFDGKDYTAVFVTGELLGLQAVKNAGKLSDWFVRSDTAQWGVPTATPSSVLFQTLRYANKSELSGGVSWYNVNDTLCRPCISLYLLMVYALQQTLGVTIPSYPSDLQNLVYIPAQYVDSNGDEISTAGTTISLLYNMPQWTGIELIQMVCNALGYLPNYENGALTFVRNVSELSSPIDITSKLIKREQVTRELAGFSRHNYVEWKDGEKYGGLAAAKTDYEIDNENIEATRVLGTIPAQPTNRTTPLYYQAYNDVALCWDKYAQSYLGPEIKNPSGADWFAFWRVYGSGDTTEKSLLQGWFYPSDPVSNSIMSLICAQATQIKIDARMTMLEYYAIGSKTTLQVDGSVYVWLERAWQKDVAKFTLAKIA